MQTTTARSDLGRRIGRCLVGLGIFAFGIGLTVKAELGVSPWDVFHQGLADKVGLPMGTVAVLVGIPILLLWIPLGQRIGIGTILNTILVGLTLNVVLDVVPDLDGLVLRWVALGVGLVLCAVGTALYITADLGTGPRDGVMMGLRAKGLSVIVARTAMEVTVLVIGYLLGGSVGIGTVITAFAIGPMVHWCLERFDRGPAHLADAPVGEMGEEAR